jgi:transcriptional regulator with XRE-family HTH domain/Zn-dependent peptidase ImmA (M78 family)
MQPIGEYLRAKRLAIPRGLRDVARALDISAAYLSRIESGDDQPSGELLVKLSKLYSVPLDTLIAMRNSEAVSAAAHGYRIKGDAEMRALYRIGDELTPDQLDLLLRQALLTKGYTEEEVEEKIAEYKKELPRLANSTDDLLALPASRRILSRSAVVNMAYEFLARHGLDEDSYAPPTEVECLIEMEPDIDYRIDRLKCRATGEPLVLGLTRWNLEGRKQIVVNTALADSNKESDSCRFNFTLGHELFHAIEHLPLTPRSYASSLRRLGPIADVVFVDRSETRARVRFGIRKSAAQKAVDSWAKNTRHNQLETDEEWREWQADVFSSALLMPGWSVQSEFRERTAVDSVRAGETGNARELALSVAGEVAFESGAYEQSLAQKFKVSRQAMAIRLLDLGLVREVERQ